ncbi:MAG: class I SAM-dependent methyltransferase [Candidatus Paceibacterota bacterium]|jgi:SAM-dependent methyltransferase
MLCTLSEQERQAVQHFDDRVRRGDLEERRAFLDDFIMSAFLALPEDPEVVDVGCGFGRAVPLLERVGFTRYLGIDPSEKSIEHCRGKFPGHAFEVDEVRTIGFHYPSRFDAFFLTAVLMHLPPQDLGVAVSSLRLSLKKGAVGLFSLPYSNVGVTRQIESVGGLTVTLFAIDEVIRIFTSNGFELPDTNVCDPMFLGHAVAI